VVIRVIVFLVINFGALAIGGLFTSKGVPSDWYISLNKAPWTPPGWVFGAAWSFIMICFSFYMAQLWSIVESKNLLLLFFTLQLILNIAWNPVFFQLHHVGLGLVIISILTILVGFLIIYFYDLVKMKSALLFPYFLWLLIATSLNAYILIKN
jgi:benzodiazapine receptor|tara:strand:- start:3088 stop:3546 length:459 start_codon:yes stop_codon:yes gene_type:complete